MAAVRIQEVAAWVESMRRNLNDDAVVVFVTHGDLIAKLLNLLVTNRSGSGSGVGTVGGGKSADVNASAALSFQGIRNTSVSNVVRLTPVRFYIKDCFFGVWLQQQSPMSTEITPKCWQSPCGRYVHCSRVLNSKQWSSLSEYVDEKCAAPLMHLVAHPFMSLQNAHTRCYRCHLSSYRQTASTLPAQSVLLVLQTQNRRHTNAK